MKSKWSSSLNPNFYQTPNIYECKYTDTNNCIYTLCYQNNLDTQLCENLSDYINTFTHLLNTLINKYHPTISVNREGVGVSPLLPPFLTRIQLLLLCLGANWTTWTAVGKTGKLNQGIQGFSPDDMTQFFPFQSSSSRNRSAFNNNTKEDRSDGNLTFRGGGCLAHLFAEAPISQRAFAVEGATRFSQRINESEDRSASLLTTLALDTPNDLKGHSVQPGV